ncbi:sensor domain-containing diguanylate cyclase [Oryzomonas sagensis]|uniref:diguanylate cyclase n=2 Tax=Oryzomonas sagensis TaxID=2603857 RepID=A0ABQ6TTZ9_9BACT|nr:sensor domain-containing diguanylate cyclase [Oryzomonas sagensis]
MMFYLSLFAMAHTGNSPMPTRSTSAIFSSLLQPSPLTISIVNIVLLVMLGWLDYITGDYSLIIFYLIPVSLAAWHAGRAVGACFCLLAFITRLVADGAGTSFSFSYSPLHYWNVFVEFVFLLIMSFLVAALKRHLYAERSLASSDPLTGLLNRHAFFESAAHELHRSRQSRQPISIACIDLNNFKEINNRFGHKTGDGLLVEVADTIRATTRSSDLHARFGSDEFVVLMPDTDSTAALPLLETLHHHLRQAMAHKDWPVGFTIGAVTSLHDLPAIGEFVHRAEELARTAKGRDTDGIAHVVV